MDTNIYDIPMFDDSDLLINKLLQGLKNNIKYLPIHRIFVLLLAAFYKYV